MSDINRLSSRERQIMELVYASGEASATEIWQRLPDPPTRTAARTIIGILESKGHLRHRKKGREFIYQPTRPRKAAGQSALRRVVQTFFSGSIGEALAAHLADNKVRPSDQELKKLAEMIRDARNREI